MFKRIIGFPKRVKYVVLRKSVYDPLTFPNQVSAIYFFMILCDYLFYK